MTNSETARTPGRSPKENQSRPARRSLEVVGPFPSPTSRQLFGRSTRGPAPAPAAARESSSSAGGAEPFVLAAELYRAMRRMGRRVAQLEAQLAESEAKRLESERVAEHALKLANGVISAIKNVQKENKPTRQPSGETRFTRCTVDGVSVIQCTLCAFTCGTLSALDRHRANAHSLRCADDACAPAPIPLPSPRRSSLARSPPRAASSGLGRADMSFLDQIRAVEVTPSPPAEPSATASAAEPRPPVSCAARPDRFAHVNALAHTARERLMRQRG